MKKLLSISVILLAVLNLADMAITAVLLTHSRMVAEANALMRALWDTSPLAFMALKLSLSASFLLLLRHIHRARRWVCFAVVPTAAVYCGVVGWSLYVLMNTL